MIIYYRQQEQHTSSLENRWHLLTADGSSMSSPPSTRYIFNAMVAYISVNSEQGPVSEKDLITSFAIGSIEVGARGNVRFFVGDNHL